MNMSLCGVFVSVSVIAGANAGDEFVPSYPLYSISNSAEFGYSVSGAGDVNGDGFDDLIVGAPAFNDAQNIIRGSARVHSGKTGLILYTRSGDSAGDRFGESVSGAGDVNGDGFDDLIVGAPNDDNNGSNCGSARVFSGAAGVILYTLNGDSAGDSFGHSVSGAGDVNGDGFDDVIVGAPGDNNASGSARVFSGATSAILHTFHGDSTNDSFGASVSGAGDVNGDGFDDLIVGAPGDNNFAGSARALSGADGEILHTFDGDSSGDQFGRSVSGAGDVNGDGFDDLIVGAPAADKAGLFIGSARVFSGEDGEVLYTFFGDSDFSNFGYSVSGAGDVNGDGFDDVIVGEYGDDTNGSRSGRARVFSGADGAILYTFYGDSATDEFGWSVSDAGDVNGDGFADVIVGAPSDSNALTDGSARAFFLAPSPSKPCPGDLDGDGDADFADLNIVISNFNTSCAP